jgi:CRISP-associated protein Cas1
VNTTPDPLPVRMVNEYAFCPRLFHLMHVDGRWDDNLYTDQGRSVHRRTDEVDDVLPAPAEGGDEPPAVVRSVSLGSESLGISGKLDLVETEGDLATPVDTKRGAVPGNPLQSYEPERVQLMAQGLLLREHGFRCTEGMLYFAASIPPATTPCRSMCRSRGRASARRARRCTSPRARSNLANSPSRTSPSLSSAATSRSPPSA